MSLPTRECGLKYFRNNNIIKLIIVTPYAGVWIEIVRICIQSKAKKVTPYAGVWIEIKIIRVIV